MLKQLTTALVVLLGFGLIFNSCDDSNPSFTNPDPLDTGSNSIIPDSLKPDPSDTSGQDDTNVNKPPEKRVRLAIAVRFDSSRASGSDRIIYIEGADVKVYQDAGGTPGNLIANRTTETVNNPPQGAVPGGFENKTSYPDQDIYALFTNNNQTITSGRNYQVAVDTLNYNGAELVTKSEFVTISINQAREGWAEKEIQVQPN